MFLRLSLILALIALSSPAAALAGQSTATEEPAAAAAAPAEDDFLRSGGVGHDASPGPVPSAFVGPMMPEPQPLRAGRKEVMYATYVAGYTGAAYVGTRLGLDNEYRIMRVESAYMYDVFGHIFFARELGLALGSVNRWAGMEQKQSQRVGAWYGAFGMQTFQELLNGFMPGVRLDPVDLVSNAVGAW